MLGIPIQQKREITTSQIVSLSNGEMLHFMIDIRENSIEREKDDAIQKRSQFSNFLVSSLRGHSSASAAAAKVLLGQLI